MEKDECLNVYVFAPTSTCGCSYASFINRTFTEYIPYKDKINLEVKDIQGEEAKPYNLFGNSIVIPNPPNQDKPIIFRSILEFRRFLATIYPEENAIIANKKK